MSVLLETSLGDVVIDLLVQQAPKCAENFLKLCKCKYYNFCPVSNVQRNYSLQTGDPDFPQGRGGTSAWGLAGGDRFFYPDFPKLKHSERGTVSMAAAAETSGAKEQGWAASQFIITLADELSNLDGKASVFGRVVEGFDTLEAINAAICDAKGRPLKDIRIRHTIILDDPFPDLPGLRIPAESPPPTPLQLANVRIDEQETLQEDVDEEELEKKRQEREADAQALTLEMVGDLPYAEVRPPENVLFVCKLNSATEDDDLQMIFERFGKIVSCEIIRDHKTGDSLQYAFIEFENQQDCERAYVKMEGVLIDDRRIHVDFSQSVSRISQAWRDSENKKRRSAFGGSQGLMQRTQYREGDSYQHDYRMVFGQRRGRSRSPHRDGEANKVRDRRDDDGRKRSSYERTPERGHERRRNYDGRSAREEKGHARR